MQYLMQGFLSLAVQFCTSTNAKYAAKKSIKKQKQKQKFIPECLRPKNVINKQQKYVCLIYTMRFKSNIKLKLNTFIAYNLASITFSEIYTC